MQNTRTGFALWLERLTAVAVVLVVAASMCRAFWPPFTPPWLRSFPQLQQLADVLCQESDPIKREQLVSGESESFDGRVHLLDVITPPNARLFVLDVLGSEDFDQTKLYYYLTYYLYPREVAISLDQPPTFKLNTVTGHSPASLEELQQAGYDFAVQIQPTRSVLVLPLGSTHLQPLQTQPQPIPRGDGTIAFFLPLAVAITGSRMVRWLFKDLQGVLSPGERLASGLAVGAFFLTQLTLGLRLAGARLEQVLTVTIMAWAVFEAVLLVRHWRELRLPHKARDGWWLLLVPAALILWCQFRLAGLLGLEEFDAITIWAFKAKILHCCAGKEIWTWFKNPGLAYAHLDYPLLVPLLHALTYGALGHVNEFVSKFWNQWMLLLLAWAVLGVSRFPEKRPWLAGTVATAIILLPMSREYALTEGATIPMLFYTVLSSVHRAIGMMERQAGRVRLGLLLLMAMVMVKFEGILLLGLWVILLLLDRDSREGWWPLRRWGWAGWLGLAAWLPYVMFRLHGPVLHPQSAWVSLLLTNASAVFHLLPMTWVGMLACRFLNNDFALWSSPDNQHVVWQGHWTGCQSLMDQATQGAGWVCVLLLAVAWYRGGRLRWMVFRLSAAFWVFATVVSLVWSTVQTSPMNYTMALAGSDRITAGRYLYPTLMAWFAAGFILLLRISPWEPVKWNGKSHAGRLNPPTVEHMT
jgi:hypothetical protein